MNTEKYKKLIETLPKESEELWFEYNLDVNKTLQENKKYKEVINKTIEYIQKMFETGFYNDDYYLGHLKQILQDKEVE